MLDLAALVIALTAAAGSVLAFARVRPRALVLAHAGLALFGFGLLVAALQGPERGRATGTQSFGLIAAVALAIAAAFGVAMWAIGRRGRRIPALLIGIHATVAVTGLVMLAVYALEG